MVAQIIIYIFFYIIGVVLGSFFTLATYRIPLKQDITHTRSYCTKCNHELQFLDLIPILSYLFLGGKCRYCKESISPRYIIIEFFSGLFYLLFVMSLNINFFEINISQIISILNGTFIISTLFIIGGIAKETKKVSIGTVYFGLITQVLYITYLYIFKFDIYRYIIYMFITFTESIVLTLVIYLTSKIIKNNKSNLVFDFCFLNILILIINNFIINFIKI